MNRPVRPALLDCSLRDGSYAINFQFTASDTALICRELERVGFDWIEVGHGIGLGASEAGKGDAAETDRDYLQAASGAVSKAKWGMFCIPGIARLDHVDLAADYGMRFIRIGTEVEDASRAEPFVRRARAHGMFVCANFMKSYTLEPAAFAEKARMSRDFGVDCLYLVDSAGGMLPEDVRRYFSAVREATDVPFGFHGHNNLELAVANSLLAAELGAMIIDVSLQGMGRSAGNTPAEILLVALERRGIRMGMDPLQVMDVGEKYIRPLIQRSGYESIDIVSGWAQFHSSYMGIIREFSSRYRVDPRKLILALCEHDRVNAPRDLVESLAQRLSDEGEEVFTARFHLERYHGAEQNP